MIGPSLRHVAIALSAQWASFGLLGWAIDGDTWLLLVTGSMVSGIYLGREFEQMWPHAGYKPRPPIDSDDIQRFIRQGLWPTVACYGSAVLWAVLT